MNNHKPGWWQLYLLFPLLILALFLIARSGWNTTAKSLADITAIVVTFGTMLVWMNINQGAIERAEQEQAMHARAKSFYKVRGWRSGNFPVAKTQVTVEPVPLTGFGSARTRPVITYAAEKVTADRVRLHRRITEKA